MSPCLLLPGKYERVLSSHCVQLEATVILTKYRQLAWSSFQDKQPTKCKNVGAVPLYSNTPSRWKTQTAFGVASWHWHPGSFPVNKQPSTSRTNRKSITLCYKPGVYYCTLRVHKITSTFTLPNGREKDTLRQIYRIIQTQITTTSE